MPVPTSLANQNAVKIETVPIDQLVDAHYNPRQLTEKQAADIEASVREFGLVEPIVVNRHPERQNVIVGGHQRVRIARRLGYTEVPVFYVELDEARERQLNVRLNKNVGEWDWDVLANNFDVADLEAWGFTKGDLGMIAPPVREDVPPAAPPEPSTESSIVLIYDGAECQRVSEALRRVRDARGLASLEETVAALADEADGK